MKRSLLLNGRRFTYTLIRAARRDCLFQVRANGNFCLYAPKTIRLKEADSLILQNAERVEALLRQAAVRDAVHKNAHPVLDGAVIYIEGTPHRLVLSTGRTRMEVSENTVMLTVPAGSSEEQIRGILKSRLASYMLPILRQRLDYYQPLLGVKYNRIAIRDQRSRWGSCSSKQNLNFNWKLIMAPREVLDYVVVHELCHLKVFNHSERFWALVATQIPDYEFWIKWLKEHGSDLGV